MAAKKKTTKATETQAAVKKLGHPSGMDTQPVYDVVAQTEPEPEAKPKAKAKTKSAEGAE